MCSPKHFGGMSLIDLKLWNLAAVGYVNEEGITLSQVGSHLFNKGKGYTW